MSESGIPIDDPQLEESVRNKKLKFPLAYHSPLDLFIDEFEAPSVYSITGWVQRDLTGVEFLTAMDVPSSAVNWAKEVGVFKSGDHGGLLGSPPLKILQEVGDMLYSIRNVEDMPDPTPSPTSDPTFILYSQIEGLEEIYNDINQAKVAKNDEAEADLDIWNEAICRRPSDWKTDWVIVGADNDHNFEIKYFDTLR